MGHDPAATGSGRLLIKPPKQDRAGVAATTSGQIPGSALEEARRFTSHTGCRDDTDPVSQPRAGHLQHLQAVQSWLRDEAMALDFDSEMVGFAAQPFWLFWSDGHGSASHAPDFFGRRSDGPFLPDTGTLNTPGTSCSPPFMHHRPAT
jgi:hypothetical protein